MHAPKRPHKELLKDVFSEVEQVYSEMYDTSFDDFPFERLLDFPENREPCSTYLQKFIEDSYLIVFESLSSEINTRDNILAQELKTITKGKGLAVNDETIAYIRSIHERIKEHQNEGFQPKVNIRFTNNLDSAPDKSSYLIFDEDLKSPYDIKILVNKNKFKKIDCPRWRSILLLAILLHELGHIVLEKNVTRRKLLNPSRESDTHLWKDATVEDEKEAWVFSLIVRSLARCRIEDDIGNMAQYID